MPCEIRFEDRGRPWRAQLVPAGGRYGVGDSMINHGGPMVEFYDCELPKFGTRGQLVSRYYLDTLEGTARHGAGLDLYHNEPEWSLDADSIAIVVKLMLEFVQEHDKD